jgi:hypothetical protein
MAAYGWLNPLLAAITMPLSAMAVILHTGRLKQFREGS